MRKIFTILFAALLVGTSAIAATTIVNTQAELKAAIAKVEKDATITLGASFTITSTVRFNVSKTYTLDLNGCSITSVVEVVPAISIMDGNVTITDSGSGGTIIGGTGHSSVPGGVAILVNGGELTVNGGKIIGGGSDPGETGSGMAIVQIDGTVNLFAGTFISGINGCPALAGNMFALAIGSAAKGYSNREMTRGEAIISAKDFVRYAAVVVTPAGTGLNTATQNENTLVSVCGNRLNIPHAIGREVFIYNVTGTIVCALRCTSNNEVISLPGKGIYFIRVGNYAQKVVVN